MTESICIHRTPESTGTVECAGCRGRVKLKTFGCAIYGTCTIAKPANHAGCCDGCPRKELPDSAPGELPNNVTQLYPADCQQADVLLLLGGQNNPGWWEIRGQLVIDVLAGVGITAACVRLSNRSVGTLEYLVDRFQTKLLVNRAFLVGCDAVELLIQKTRDVKVLTVNHSSLSDLYRSRAWFQNNTNHVRLARDYDQIWYAHVDERNVMGRLSGSDRCIWLPNVVRIPDPPDPRPINENPVVSLVCASRDLKNIPNQLAGLALANQRHPLRALLSIGGVDSQRPAINEFATLSGLHVSWQPWQPWTQYIEMLRQRVDVGLQVSFTESFNYVALEHQLCGCPVVTSSAVRFGGKTLRADPDCPDDIANRILHVFENYQPLSEMAMRAARQLACHLNLHFVHKIRSVLDG